MDSKNDATTMTPEELAETFAADQRTLSTEAALDVLRGVAEGYNTTLERLPAIVQGLATAADMEVLSVLKWLIRTALVAQCPMGLLLLHELGRQAAIRLAVMAQPASLRSGRAGALTNDSGDGSSLPACVTETDGVLFGQV
jgi:hypothetical protein